MVQTIVGNICESGDILAKERDLPVICEGDVLGVLDAGAYGFTMRALPQSAPCPHNCPTAKHLAAAAAPTAKRMVEWHADVQQWAFQIPKRVRMHFVLLQRRRGCIMKKGLANFASPCFHCGVTNGI
jgi:Diaminopimelate decarboxylase